MNEGVEWEGGMKVGRGGVVSEKVEKEGRGEREGGEREGGGREKGVNGGGYCDKKQMGVRR